MRPETVFEFLKARLHRQFLSQQLDAIFVATKSHQVSKYMFETPAISRQQIALKITPGLQAILKLKMHRVAAAKIACVNWP